LDSIQGWQKQKAQSTLPAMPPLEEARQSKHASIIFL